MTVPTRHIGGIKTHLRTRLQNHIFQDLVDRMADMDITIGIGRAIVEDKLGLVGPLLPHLAIEVDLLPFFQEIGFSIGKICLHREAGFGEVKGLFVSICHCVDP